MIQFNTAIGKFSLPSNLSDISVRDLDFYINNLDTPLKVWSRMTGLEEEKLKLLDLSDASNFLDFFQKPILDIVEPLSYIKIKGVVLDLDEDFGSYTWAQKILCSSALKEGEFVEAISIYLQPLIQKTAFNDKEIKEIKEIILDCSVEAVYSVLKYIISRLEILEKRDRETLKSEVSSEQKRAGIEMFNQLGDFNTIDMIAQGKVWRHDSALMTDYNTIYLKLLQNKIKAKFDKKYHEIINQKK